MPCMGMQRDFWSKKECPSEPQSAAATCQQVWLVKWMNLDIGIDQLTAKRGQGRGSCFAASSRQHDSTLKDHCPRDTSLASAGKASLGLLPQLPSLEPDAQQASASLPERSRSLDQRHLPHADASKQNDAEEEPRWAAPGSGVHRPRHASSVRNRPRPGSQDATKAHGLQETGQLTQSQRYLSLQILLSPSREAMGPCSLVSWDK